jgi:DNA-binding response OmpR family regulator
MPDLPLGTSGDILVIEDQSEIAALIVDVLTDEHYRTRTATAGSEALTAILDTRPDLVLLDLHLPDISGETLLAQIRGLAPDLPIVIITAAPREARPLIEQYEIECLAKPFELDALLDCVRRYIQPST